MEKGTKFINENDINKKEHSHECYSHGGECHSEECHCGESHTHWKSDAWYKKFNFGSIVLFLGVFLFMLAFFIPNNLIKSSILIVAYIISGYDILYKSLVNIKKGNFLDENFLMSIATVGAIALGEYREAVGVMIFYKIGEAFQDKALNNSRKSIANLVSMKATYANLKNNDGSIKKIEPEELNLNDIIIIKAGERVPTDCIVLSGSSLVDTSALTGESLPISVEKDEELLSGSINLDGKLEARVIKKYKDSAVSKIIEMVENASDKKAKSEKFITKFARYYTPAVVFTAIFVAFVIPLIIGNFSVWFGRVSRVLFVS